MNQPSITDPGSSWSAFHGERRRIAPHLERGRVPSGGESELAGTEGAAGASHTSAVALLRRRWYAAGPVLLVTLLAIFLLEDARAHEYHATGSLLLASPEVDPEQFPRRGVTLRSTVELVEQQHRQRALGADEAHLRIDLLDATNARVSTTADDPGVADDLLDQVSAGIAEHIAREQQRLGIPEDERIQVRSRSEELRVEPDASGRHMAAASVWFDGPVSLGDNPYPPTASTLRLLHVAATSDRGRATLWERLDGMVDVQLFVDVRDLAPVVRVSTYGSDPERTVAGFAVVEDFLAEELDARQGQARVPKEMRLWLDPISRPLTATRTSPWLGLPSRLVGVTGIVVSIGLAGWVDWRRRTSTRPAPDHPELSSNESGS